MIASDPSAKHIALLLHDFSAGGSERVAVRLANHWAQAGRRVTIFCGDGAGPARVLVDEEVEVRVVSPPIRRGAFSRVRLGAAIAPMVRRAHPDIIVAPGNFHAPVLWSLQKALGAAAPPSVLKISNPLYRPQRSHLGQALFSRYFRSITRDCSALVSMGPALARDVCAVTGRRDVACIPEPNLDDGWSLPAARARRGPIVWAGRLTRQKNLPLALQTLAALEEPWTLQVLGDGPQRQRLEAIARNLGVTHRVAFLGHVPDIGPFLGRASSLLCTSRYEGSPAILVEALAAGLPVVSTACTPALDEILIDPSFGQVALSNPHALAVALNVVQSGDGPAIAPLTQLMHRHRRGISAAAWLGLLDDLANESRPRVGDA